MMNLSLFGLLLAAIPVEEGPALPPLQVGAHLRQSFAFDWDGLDSTGLLLTDPITEVTFRFSTPGGDPVRWTRLMPPGRPVVAGVNRFPCGEVLRDVPPGVYHLDVSLRTAGTPEGAGSYSLPLLIEVIPPPAPVRRPSRATALRVETDAAEDPDGS